MTGTDVLPALEEPPRDDFEAADAIATILTSYTETDDPMDLPEDVRTDLDAWLSAYLKRRRAEAGVSPISPRILPYFLPEFELEWEHRTLTDNVGQGTYRLFDDQHTGPAVNVGSMRAANKVTLELRKYGWELDLITDGDEDYKARIEFEPQQHDFELFRRLLLAGLDQVEAIAFWALEVADLTHGETDVNPYLKSSESGRVNRAALVAAALDLSEPVVESAADEAQQKLSAIDPGLPELLRNGTGGHPLPDELWTDRELARLASARESQ